MKWFLILVLLLAALVGGGMYLGWFSFRSDTTSGGTTVQVNVNTPKVKEDVNKAGTAAREMATTATEKAGEVGEKAKEAAGKVAAQARDFADGESATGPLVRVDAEKRVVTVRDEKQGEVTATLAADALVRSGGEPKPFSELKAGDRVRVLFKTKDGQRTATSVIVNP
jgi:Cu/Ag efflux protein CusF